VAAVAFASGTVVALPTVVVEEGVVVAGVVVDGVVVVELEDPAAGIVEVVEADAAPVETRAAGTTRVTAAKAIRATRWSERKRKRIRPGGTPPRGKQGRATAAR